MAARHTPWAPPLVEMATGMVGHLLAWERHERDGSWWAWVSWVQESGGRHHHKVVHVRAPESFLTWAGENSIEVLAASGQADVAHWSASYRPPLAVLLGSEGEGLPAGLLASAGRRIRIPMTGTAESLNVAAAAAILLYEVKRHKLGQDVRRQP